VELLMPVLSLIFWGIVICILWFWLSPRSFGKFWGKKYIQATDGGKPSAVAGLKTLLQFILMVVVTVICFNIYPFSLFIIAFVWVKWFRSIWKIDPAVQIEEPKDNESAS
jgi:hypothetical protein